MVEITEATSGVEPETPSGLMTLEEVMMEAGRVTSRLSAEYGLPPDVAFDIYKWEQSNFLAYRATRGPGELIGGENDEPASPDGGADVSTGNSPA